MRWFIGWIILGVFFLLLFACQPAPAPADQLPAASLATVSPTPLPPSATPLPASPTPTSTPLPTQTPLPSATRLPPTLTPTHAPQYLAEPYYNEQNVLLRFTTEQDWVILTIDDGLSKSAALEMLDALKEANVRATFFLAGKCAKGNLGAEVMQRMASEGHEIAYHSMNHDDLEALKHWSLVQWEQDYTAWQKALRDTLGDDLYAKAVRPFARAPYGLFSKTFLQMCANQNLLPVGWSCDPLCVDGTLPLPGGRILIYHVRGDQVASLQQLLGLGRPVLPLGDVAAPVR